MTRPLSFSQPQDIKSQLPDTTVLYSYVTNVNRIFGEDHPLGDLNTSTHIVNASFDDLKLNKTKIGKLTLYGYLIDFDNASVTNLSSKTFGLRFTGNLAMAKNRKLIYSAEYARQSNYADNPRQLNANYWLVEWGVAMSNITLKAGFESLGSNSHDDVVTSFQTPLATLHKFNGWADKFLITPAYGLDDIYIDVSYQLAADKRVWSSDFFKGMVFKAVYHRFSAATGGADYGSEWNLMAQKKLSKYYGLQFKYADYNADNFSTNTQKIWLTLSASY